MRAVILVLLIVLGTVCFAAPEGYVNINEGRLYYRQVGQGTPIIVVHGGPGLDQSYLQPQLFQLSENHIVIFYDQRGSGKSIDTPLDPKHINLHQFVEDLEDLRLALGLDTFIVMGHSWGGVIAMEYAIKHQDHLIGLILLNTAPANEKGQRGFLEEFGLRTESMGSQIAPLFRYKEFEKLNATEIADLYRKCFSVYFHNRFKVNELSLIFSIASAQSGFRVMEEMMRTSWLVPGIDLFPGLKTLKVPTLILHGKQDVVPLWTAREIQEAIVGAKIVILDHCGHFPYIEQPKRFFKELDKFLDKLTD